MNLVNGSKILKDFDSSLIPKVVSRVQIGRHLQNPFNKNRIESLFKQAFLSPIFVDSILFSNLLVSIFNFLWLDYFAISPLFCMYSYNYKGFSLQFDRNFSSLNRDERRRLNDFPYAEKAAVPWRYWRRKTRSLRDVGFWCIERAVAGRWTLRLYQTQWGTPCCLVFSIRIEFINCVSADTVFWINWRGHRLWIFWMNSGVKSIFIGHWYSPMWLLSGLNG